MQEKLKLTLFRKRITQSELAKAVGVSDAQISRIVRGQSRCRAKRRRIIAEFLGLREHEIFSRHCARKLTRTKKKTQPLEKNQS
jgi:transcriptional regulator with XRE-family HTH domain